MSLIASARLPLLLSLILFSVIFMTFWWRNLFHGYLEYYTQSELFRAELELRKTVDADTSVIKTLLREKKIKLVTACSGEPCVRYGEKFLEIHEAFRKNLVQTRNSRWNMIWWETSFLIILLTVSGIFLLIIHFRDRARDKEADEFAAMAAHELKHPISSLSLLLQSLKRKSIPAAKQSSYIDKGLAEINSLREQIDVLLKLKENADFRKPEKRSYEITELIHEITEKFTTGDKNQKSRIRFTSVSENEQTVINRESLKLILKNILENALLYSDDAVDIALSNSGKMKIITISDKGMGFSSEDRKKIGNMFFRSSRHKVQNIKGSGLGLFTVYKLAKLTGIKIELLSEGENSGSTFRIKLS